MELTVSDLVSLVQGRLIQGDPALTLRAFDSLRECGPDGLSFFGNELYQKDFESSRAGAVLVRAGTKNCPGGAAIIEVDDPVLAFDVVVRRFGAPEIPFLPGVHPSAVIGEDVQFDPDKVCIGPFVHLANGVVLGDGCWLGAYVSLGESVTLGRGCRLYDHVSVREGCRLGDRVVLQGGVVIGADGYGYQFKDGRHQPIRQAGIVILEDDVEVGANSTIDRARFGSTVIGEGTKIDNLVQVAHNVITGKHCLIVALSGLSGSSRLGNYVTVAAQSGVAGHVAIGDKAVLGGRSGVISNLEGGETYFGYPAKTMKEWSRQQVYAKKVPKLVQRVAELEAKIAALEARLASQDESQA
jgi:UDP-3-O-[3-hydroxymyristoyl] glucosamine N-acyltransferase